MTGKQMRKLRKRAHIAAAIRAQRSWIEEGLGIEFEVDSRRMRDQLFPAARRHLESQHAARR